MLQPTSNMPTEHLLQSAYLPEEDEDCRQEDAALPDGTPQGVDLGCKPLLHHLWGSQHLCCKQASCSSHSLTFVELPSISKHSNEGKYSDIYTTYRWLQ